MRFVGMWRWRFVPRDYKSPDPDAERVESGSWFDTVKFQKLDEEEAYDAEKRPVLIKERMAMKKIEMNREHVHDLLDNFLDKVEADPLNIEDGEGHTFELFAAGGIYGAHDEELITYKVKTTKEENA